VVTVIIQHEGQREDQHAQPGEPGASKRETQRRQ
jgi:hypothetical protein